MLTLKRKNDFVLTWFDMDLGTDGSWVTNAVVTMSLYVTSTDVVVSGASALTMSYVSGSNATYQGRIPASALPSSLSLGELYYITVDATSGSYTAYAKLEAQLVERTT